MEILSGNRILGHFYISKGHNSGFITSIDISTYANINGDIIWKQNIRTFLHIQGA